MLVLFVVVFSPSMSLSPWREHETLLSFVAPVYASLGGIQL